MTFEEFADKHGIIIEEARSIPARSDIPDQWSKDSHHFHVTLALKTGGVLWSGEYSLGAGCPIIWAQRGCTLPPHARKEPKAGRPVETRDMQACNLWQRIHPKPDYVGRGLSVADVPKWGKVKARFDAVAPLDVAEILESLALDSMGSDESFADWCHEMGYDEDFRKAYKIYNACRDIAGSLRRALGYEVFLELINVDGEEMEDIVNETNA